jgi:hypothetical protein
MFGQTKHNLLALELEAEIEVMRNLRFRLRCAASKLGVSAVLIAKLMGRGLTCLSVLPYSILPVITWVLLRTKQF